MGTMKKQNSRQSFSSVSQNDSSMAYLLLGSKMMSTGSMESEKPNPTQGKINMTVKGVLARKKMGLMNSEAMAKALIASIMGQGPQPVNLMELTGQKMRSKRPSTRYVPPSMREMQENNPARSSEKMSVDQMMTMSNIILDNRRSSQLSGAQSPTRKCAFASRESNRCERGNATRTWRSPRTPSPPRLSVVPANNPWNQPVQRVTTCSSNSLCVPRPSSLSDVNLQQRAVYRLPAPGARNNQGIQSSWRRRSCTNSVKSNESFEG